MSNKFSNLVKQNKTSSVNLSVLLDDGDQDLVISEKKEGRFLSLPASSFSPDPNQPRKSFSQETIDALRVSIETSGQLQPILVGDQLKNGQYPIIAGERRWRAISESKIILEVKAVKADEGYDESRLLLMQIEENSQREHVPAYENALAMKRLVDICRKNGEGQSDAAKLLNISPSQLSKHLALISASKSVIDLATEKDGIQDIEVLYNLSKIAKTDQKEADKFIDQWRSGNIETNLRKASRELAEKKNSKAITQEKTITTKKVQSARIDCDSEKMLLTLSINGKSLEFELNESSIDSLKRDIENSWSKENV